MSPTQMSPRAWPPVRNILTDAGPEVDGPGERFVTLAQGPALRLEQIVSHGQCSPAGFWYEQSQAEWVMLVRGQATLRFGEGEVELGAGDHLLIPAHVRHRVERCSGDAVWLALHAEIQAAPAR